MPFVVESEGEKEEKVFVLINERVKRWGFGLKEDDKRLRRRKERAIECSFEFGEGEKKKKEEEEELP